MDERIIELLSVERASAFSRYDENHPLNIYLGLDGYGRKCLAIASKAKIVSTKSTKTIAVDYEEQENDTKLYFSLLDDGMFDIFCKFCDDIISNTRSIEDDDETFAKIIDRWDTWMYFFSKKPFMSEEKIRGLVGELFYLKNYMYIMCDTVTDAIAAYVGPDGYHRDFEIGDTWYEIKSPHEGWDEVRISSVEQLDVEAVGQLVVISLEKTTSVASDALTLNAIVRECKEGLSSAEASVFDEKLRKLGYIPDEQYDEYRYLFRGINTYEVKDDFPRLMKQDLPDGIVKASYAIARSALQKYEVLLYER